MQILDLLKKLQEEFPDFEWNVPPDLKMGILTTNEAFKFKAKSKKQKAKSQEEEASFKSPLEYAQYLVGEIQAFVDAESLPIVVRNLGPYINLDLTESGWQKEFNLKLTERSENWREKGNNKTVLIDYFSPNIGKKMHVGHIRSADIGESLRRILSLKYEKVISNNHLGDWGIQSGYIIWGLQEENFKKLNLDFELPQNIELSDFNLSENRDKASNYSEFFYQIYIKVNQLGEKDENIKKEAQQITKLLETGATNLVLLTEFDSSIYQNYLELYKFITSCSVFSYLDAEKYLNLNQHFFGKNTTKLIDVIIRLNELDKENKKINFGRYRPKSTIQDNNWDFFDMVFGESFYIQNNILAEFDYLVEKGLAIREEQAIYVDLEAEKLGRCYLISSEGYSLYHSRDIIARFIWSGLIGADLMLTLADNRQSHSFNQVFAIIKKIIDNKIYENRNFGWLNREETERALKILKDESVKHIGFGFMTLHDGAMSTRKGKIVAFEELKETLEKKVIEVLSQKENQITKDKVQKIAVATLKWTDLYRDREQDIVFDFDQFLKFEGNTGVYQLYTLARVNSILGKNKEVISHKSLVVSQKSNFTLLNPDEQLILKTMYQLPLILEQICLNYKPHLLCNHLFDLATQVNSWYGKYSVSGEENLERKQVLLEFCQQIKEHFWFGLELLGIEPLEGL